MFLELEKATKTTMDAGNLMSVSSVSKLVLCAHINKLALPRGGLLLLGLLLVTGQCVANKTGPACSTFAGKG
jgi:hypothetical protein